MQHCINQHLYCLDGRSPPIAPPMTELSGELITYCCFHCEGSNVLSRKIFDAQLVVYHAESDLWKMSMFLLAGVAGAALTVTLSIWGVLKDDVLVDQLTVVKPGWSLWITWAVIGFVFGFAIWYFLSFLRIRVIRLLLSYDHWFIGRANILDYVGDLWSLEVLSHNINIIPTVYHSYGPCV